MVRFLLNDIEKKLANIDPNTSVLDYLRDHIGRTGTKEGCASGDCGACTVVLAEANGGCLTYSSINSCVTPVGNLHGKQLITVEDLKNGDDLHPVQQAMVDCHGSQCGFCTPGFVMSMFAYRKNYQAPTRQSIIEALGGNLCRCTGYRPIINAALRMFDPALPDKFSDSETHVASALRKIVADTDEVKLSGNGKHYFSPTSVEELATILEQYPEARLVAGGTDLSLEITQLLRNIDTLVYTGRVQELLQVTSDDQHIEIGAAATYAKCQQALETEYPDLHELIERLGSRQIRNQGTVGGNIGNASPIGDMPPVLIALNAQLVLRKGAHTRTLPVEDYFIGYKVTTQQPGEFIEKIVVPRAKPGYELKAYKISKRLEDDISAICGVFYLNIDNGRVADASIAFGGMAEIPRRASHCEQAFKGQIFDQQAIQRGMDALDNDFAPITDFRASADYRRRVTRNLLQRLYFELDTSPEDVRVTRHA